MPDKPPDQTISLSGFADADSFGAPELKVSAGGTGGTASSTSVAGGTGGAGPTTKTATNKRRPGGSTQTPEYGRMSVKIYPLNEDQLALLGMLRGVASVALAFAGTFLGLGVNVFKDLQINSGTPVELVARWQTIGYLSLGASVFCLLVAGYFWYKGDSTMKAIEARVTFI